MFTAYSLTDPSNEWNWITVIFIEENKFIVSGAHSKKKPSIWDAMEKLESEHLGEVKKYEEVSWATPAYQIIKQKLLEGETTVRLLN